MSKIFDRWFIDGSYITDNISGVITGSCPFIQLEKGYSVTLTSGNSISWTIPSSDITNIISYIRGIGTYRVTLNSTNIDITSSLNTWQFQNSTISQSNVTTISITATSGTIYVNRVVLLNGTDEVTQLNKEFLNSKPTIEPKSNFQSPIVTDLSNTTGLVAAYTPSYKTVVGGQLLDISGNGNHGTINGALLSKDGMKFDGVDDSVINCATPTTIGSILVRFKTGSSVTSPSGLVLYGGITGNNRCYIAIGMSGKISGGIGNTPITSLYGTTTLSINTLYDAVITWDGTIVKLYLNGNVEYSSIQVGITTTTTKYPIGAYFNTSTYSSYYNSEIQDLKIYNYAFTPQQVKAYHNSFTKPVLRDTFKDTAVGNYPKDWKLVSGTAEVQERITAIPELGLNIGDKYVKQLTAGISAIPSKQAYGEWEFDVYKGSTDYKFSFLSQDTSDLISGSNYHFRITDSANNTLEFQKRVSGTFTRLFRTADNYIANNTDYRIKVARLKSAGMFKDIGDDAIYPANTFAVFIKGGNFGTDKWTLVDTTSGSGSNPVVDATYTTSEYLVTDLDAGDTFSNLKILNQVNQ